MDITFPDNAKLVDVVFGFCEPGINTHLDFDQQLARVRHPGAVKVWITPRCYKFETHLDVVRYDIMRAGLTRTCSTAMAMMGSRASSRTTL